MKCCIDGCEAQGTVCAPHPDADTYCPAHGTCRGCGESVRYFLFVEEIGQHGAWVCPCVSIRRHERIEVKPYEPGPPEEKKVIQFGDAVARKKRKRPTG